MVPAIQNATPSSRNSALSNGLMVAPSLDGMVRPSRGEAPIRPGGRPRGPFEGPLFPGPSHPVDSCTMRYIIFVPHGTFNKQMPRKKGQATRERLLEACLATFVRAG